MQIMTEAAKTCDVFLSYNSQEHEAILALKSKLQERDINCWLDDHQLLPVGSGPAVAVQLHNAIERCAVFVAFVGPAMIGPWQASEIVTATASTLQRRATEVGLRDRVILVCLPGLTEENRTALRDALKLDSAIVFESHLDEQMPFRRLLNEIKGKILQTQPERVFIKENPYKGLAAFQEEDHDRFFGREELTRNLIGHIRTALDKETPRLLILLGASGSGKSSLARAGVVAWLKNGEITGSANWDYATLIPSDDPLASLAHAVAGGLEQSVAQVVELAEKIEPALRDSGEETLSKYLRHVKEGHKFVLLVDQFEEIFTLCHDNDVRRAFIDNLLFAASQRNGPGIVILTVRSDFHAALVDWCGIDHPKYTGYLHSIGSVKGDELRAAITQPAQAAGVNFAPDLLDRLQEETEAHDLPLLQYVLFKLWSYRRTQKDSAGKIITLDAYRAIGSVRDVLKQRADAIYQRFSPDEQAIVRHIFLNLLRINEDAPVTRQRMSRAGLIPHGIEKERVEAIINRLVKERLLVTDDGKVEIIHEALIKNWPALEGWLNEYGKDLKSYQQIKEAAQRWEQEGRDDADVYSGNRLASALEWQKQNAKAASPLHLSKSAEEFLHAGEKKAQAAKRRKIAGVAFVVSLVVIFTAWLGIEWARSERLLRLSEARRTAAEAQAARDTQFDLSLLLAVAGEQDHPDMAESRGALLSTTLSHPNLAAFLQGHTDRVWHLAFSHDGHTLASTGWDDDIILWDVRDPQAPRKIQTLQGHTDRVLHLVFSPDPDSHTLASASDDGSVILWDVHDPQAPRKIKALPGHRGSVLHLAFSHDGHTLVSASNDGSVILWDVRNPQAPRKIKTLEEGHTDGVSHLAFSHDDHTLASASLDKTVILWDVHNPQVPRKIQTLQGHRGWVTHLAFSNDDHSLALASTGLNDNVILWDVHDPQAPRKIQVLPGHTDGVLHLAFSPDPDSHTLASAGMDNTVILWDMRNPQAPRKIQVLQDHTNEVNYLTFSRDGHTLASASLEGTIILWDVHDPQAPRKIQALQGHMGSILHLAFSRDGHTLASASKDKTVILWDVRNPQAPQRIQALRGHTERVNHLALSPDDHTLASASYDNTVILWDVRDPQAPRKIQVLQQGHISWINHLAFSRDGHTLASASEDRTVILWDVRDPQAPRKIQALQGHMGAVEYLAFSHDGHTLASASEDRTVILWDVRDPQAPRKIQALEGHTGRVNHLAFSSDSHTLALASWDKPVILWDVRDPQAPPKIQALQGGHADEFNHLAFSPDGHTLVSAGDNNAIILWDVRDPQAPRKIQALQDHAGEVTYFAFSPDGHILASAGDDNAIILWDVRDPQTPRKIQALQGHTILVSYLAFSSDGHTLVSASTDNTVIMWDVCDPQIPRKIQVLRGHTGVNNRIAFSPNGHTLASTSSDSTIILWNLNPASLARKACRIAGRNMTRDEWRQYIGDDKPYRKICEEFPVPGEG